jgi:ribose 5-phosphate isomerase B
MPDQPITVALACDHAAVELKHVLIAWLGEQGHATLDLGTDGPASVDYPDFGYALAEAIADGRARFGVALCGSGIGISIAVNRHPQARCARVSEPLSARLAREHNDANVIAMGARLIGPDMARECLATFLATEFLGGRHAGRVAKLDKPPVLKEPA